MTRFDDADGGRRKRRVDEADADTGDKEAGEERRPGRVDGDARHQQQRDAAERESAGQKEPHGHACRQPPGDRRDDEREQRERQEDHARLDGGVAQNVLEVERQEEELSEHSGRDRKGSDLRTGERRHLEKPDVEHRRLPPQLDHAEGDEQHGRGDEEADDAPARPAPVAAAKEAEHEREQAARECDEAGHVEAAGFLVARLVQDAQTGRDAGDPDREVDEEDPTPADVGRERASDERPDRDGSTDRRAPDPERGAPLAAVELLRDDRERDGEHRGPADSLHTPRHDQPVRRLRRAAQGRSQREEGDPAEEDTLASSYVAERAGVEQRRREGKGVGVDDPLQIGEGGVQLLVDVRQRDVDYGDVEEQHEDRHAHDDEDAPFPLH